MSFRFSLKTHSPNDTGGVQLLQGKVFILLAKAKYDKYNIVQGEQHGQRGSSKISGFLE